MLLYVTVMFKPLIPVISDTFSHTFNEMSHIATIHAKYGSNHLAAELADTGRDENSKSHDTSKPVSEVPVHVATDELNAGLSLNAANKNYCFFTLRDISPVYIFFKAPPPRFS